jgi:diguanylate cyclase (GGDEF)-like protein
MFGSQYVSNAEWFLQIMFAFFFIAGFDAYYQHITTRVLSVHHQSVPRWLLRVYSVVLLFAVANIMAFGGRAVVGNAGIYHTVGFFVLIFPLIDEQINTWEYLARVAILVEFWTVYHWPNILSWRSLLSYAILLVMVLVVRKFREAIRYNLFYSYAAMLIIAAAFWLTLPAETMGMHLPTFIIVRGLITMSVLNLYTSWYWRHRAQQRKENDRLRELSTYDDLTYATAYTAYRDELSQLFKQAKTQHEPLTLVSLDVDHFKQVNDQYGHLAGNSVLIGVATTLKAILDRHGLDYRLYRTGGEEFNIAFVGATPHNARAAFNECLIGIRNHAFTYEDQTIKVTVSLGVTEVQSTDHLIDDTYKRADDNLYLSKRAGCDTISVNGVTQNLHAENDLVATYTFFAQGIVDITQPGNPRYRNELLLRMFDHGYGRWVVPERFDISVDTQIDLMQRVLRQGNVHRIAINLTLDQFEDVTVAIALSDFARKTAELTELTVEITDVPDIVTTRQITAIYRASGVRVDIDDVGSDNSYELVQHLLPYVDGVKFAMQNLRKTNTAEQLQARISFWADIAKQQALGFVLEGVENADEVTFAKEQGIHLIQGYYFSKPALPS